MGEKKIIIYGTNWCGDCRRVRRLLDQNNIVYQYINIDVDKDAEEFVFKVNNGLRSVPTIVFEDGSILVEPSNRTLAEKLRLSVGYFP